MPRTELHHCPIDTFSLPQTVERVIAHVKADGPPIQHCSVNTFKFLLMEKNRELREIVHSCGIINADGQSVVWALRLLGRPIAERVTGIDLMEALVDRANEDGLRVYFFGSRASVLENVVTLYRKRYPNLQIAGFHHGYLHSPEEELQLVKTIAATRPHLLFVALDSPKKEFFLGRFLHQLQTPFAMGVGGSFDVISGMIPRAPLWMQRNGMEWLWRLSRDPRRMWKRYLLSHTHFLRIIIQERFNRGKSECCAPKNATSSIKQPSIPRDVRGPGTSAPKEKVPFT